MAAFTKASVPIFTLIGLSTAMRMPAETKVIRDATAAVDIPRSEPTQLHMPSTFQVAKPPNQELRVREVSPTVAEVAGASYIGCYQNGSNDILTVTALTDFGLTPELCRNWCELENVPYFAMERGYYCYCGEQIEGFAVSAAESECNSACDGGETALCGGSARVNVYSITDSDATDGIPAATTTVELTTTDAAGSTVVETSTIVQGGSDSDSTAGSGGSGNSNSDSDESNSGSSSGSESDSDSGSSVPIGAIVGGVVGGVAILAIIAGLMMWFCFRRMKKEVAEAKAEVAAARNQPGMPPNSSMGHSQGYGFAGAKPEGNVYASPTTPGGTDMYQQTPHQPSVSPMPQNEGYAVPPAAHAAPPPPVQAAPQEVSDTSQRFEMGNFYKR